MSCETNQQLLLEIGFDPGTRRRLAEALAHLETCERCRAAIAEADRVAALLSKVDGDEETPTEGWESFERSLLDAVRTAPTQRRRWKWTRFTLAVAASLVLASAGLVAGLGAWFRSGRSGPSPSVVARLTDGEVAQRTRAFAEIDRVFDGRAGWVLLSGEQSDMGLSATGAPAVDRKPLLVRLDISRRGQFVCNADVMIISGQTADVTLPTASGSLHCRLGTSAVDSSRLSLRAELFAQPSQEVQALLSTTLRLQGSDAVPVGQLITPDGAYDLRVLFALPDKAAQNL